LTDAGGGTVLLSLLLHEALTPTLLRIAFSAHTKRDEPNRSSNEEEEEIIVGNESNSGATNCIGKEKLPILPLPSPSTTASTPRKLRTQEEHENIEKQLLHNKSFAAIFSFPSRNQTPKEIDEKQSAKQQTRIKIVFKKKTQASKRERKRNPLVNSNTMIIM
jgi:hypothetical protein